MSVCLSEKEDMILCVWVCVCLNSGVIKIYLNDLTGYILFLLSIHCVFDECITNFTRFLNIKFSIYFLKMYTYIQNILFTFLIFLLFSSPNSLDNAHTYLHSSFFWFTESSTYGFPAMTWESLSPPYGYSSELSPSFPQFLSYKYFCVRELCHYALGCL